MEALGKWLGATGLMLALALASPALATAAPPAPLGLDDCKTVDRGLRQCSGLVPTWDGVPLDTTVTLPKSRQRNLPLVALIHGLGNSKHEYLYPGDSAYTGNAFEFARDGYAVLTYTARGFWGSCGTPQARLANATACANGYIHLADIRYEARDTQELIGRLVDQGVAKAGAIGVTGDSYGGGQTFELAALKDRVALPSGRLIRWKSPKGRKLGITAAAPVIPWTDLAYAAAPNGRTSVRGVMPRSSTVNPVGVSKATFVTAILAATQTATGPGQPVGEPFVIGRPMGYLALPGTNFQANVTGWVARQLAGEPYDNASARKVVQTIEGYHSPYTVDPKRPPPLFVASGFTDDLFPVDEALRFTNRTEARYPDVPITTLFGDFGHQRASQKQDVRDVLVRSIRRFFDDHLRGRGRGLREGSTAYTQTCPRGAPSGGPFRAKSFMGLARGEVDYRSEGAQSFSSLGGSLAVGRAIDPVTGGGDACAKIDAADQPNSATYRLPKASGYTLLGAPTVSARVRVSGARPADSQIASRLWDVAPDGKQTLVARSTLRPRGSGRERWELHPNGWRFAPGHVPKLELLGSDLPYARVSNPLFSIEVRDLKLELPVRRRP